MIATWIRGNGEIPLRDQDQTIAMALRAAGYRTAVIGKWGLGQPGTTGQPHSSTSRRSVRDTRTGLAGSLPRPWAPDSGAPVKAPRRVASQGRESAAATSCPYC